MGTATDSRLIPNHTFIVARIEGAHKRPQGRCTMGRKDRPTGLPVQPDNIPDDLKTLNRWVVWRYEWSDDKGKWDKPPSVVANGQLRRQRHASSTDPSTWGSFKDACTAYEQGGWDGVGFMLTKTDGFWVLDLDDCVDGHDVAEYAAEIVRKIDSYTEFSASGTGLHVAGRGALPGTRRRGGVHDIELYENVRYIAMTGQHVANTPSTIENRQAEIEALYREQFPEPEETDLQVQKEHTLSPAVVAMSDKELLERARNAANGPKVRRLYDEGDIENYPSPSEGDLALCSILAFFAGPDPERIDQLFRKSALCREKWETRPDYRERTIRKAINGCREFYSPKHARGNGGGPEGGNEQDPLNDLHTTDAGNAEALKHCYGDELRYDHRRGRWLIWKGHRWGPDADGQAQRFAMSTVRARQRAVLNAVGESRKSLGKWAFGSESEARIRKMLKLARSIKPLAIPGDELDTNPWLLGCTNGVVDLRTGSLHPGRPEDKITMCTGVRFDPEARAPRWDAFLNQIFEEDHALIQFIKRAVGYTLTGTTQEQLFFTLHGHGSNGKSTFLGALRSAFGDYARNTPMGTFKRDRNRSATNDMATLAGSRLVTASETQQDTQFDMERIRAVTGTDPITARFLYKEHFTFMPTFVPWFALNSLPVVRDDSYATWRRICVIPFTRAFVGSDVDRELPTKLAEEVPGILRWAIEGAVKWKAQGLDPKPERVRHASLQYRATSDPVAAFVEDCLDTSDVTATTPASVLYDIYAKWCQEARKRPETRTKWGMRLAEMGLDRKHTRDGNVYYCRVV